jgi:hypothetical protein
LHVDIQRRQESEDRSQKKVRASRGSILTPDFCLLTSSALGDSSEGVTPVPIPNTAVKPLSPDGTARAKCVGE